MHRNAPSPLIQAVLLSIGTTATAYRVFNNFGIALALGCALGLLATASLKADESRRAAEQNALQRERERRKAQAERE